MTFDAFTDAWDALWRNVWTWVGCMLIVGILTYAVTLPVSLATQGALSARALELMRQGRQLEIFLTPEYWFSLGAQTLAGLFVYPLQAGLIWTGVRQLRGQPVTPASPFELNGAYWRLILFWVLYTLIVWAGIMLCILPGLLAAAFFMPAQVLIIERGMPVLDAMKTSARAVGSNCWIMVGIAIVAALAGMLGLIGCCIGVFLTAGLIPLTNAAIYRQLFDA